MVRILCYWVHIPSGHTNFLPRSSKLTRHSSMYSYLIYMYIQPRSNSLNNDSSTLAKFYGRHYRGKTNIFTQGLILLLWVLGWNRNLSNERIYACLRWASYTRKTTTSIVQQAMWPFFINLIIQTVLLHNND